MKSPVLALGALAAATLVMAGCSTIGQAAGLTKTTPDEFNVVTKAPLVVPPEFGLRPPDSGAALPRELDAARRGQTILFGEDLGGNASAGERALITAAGARTTDPAIRTRIDFEEGGVIRKNRSFVDRVLFFVPGSDSEATGEGTPLDAETEEERLSRERVVTSATGGQPIIIERQSRGRLRLPGT